MWQVRDCLDHSAAPMDGATLSEALHNRGINIRYLGKIADSLSKIKQLEYLYNIAIAEILMRTVKHVFTVYMQVSMRYIVHLTSFFLYNSI
jgi:protein TIF31